MQGQQNHVKSELTEIEEVNSLKPSEIISQIDNLSLLKDGWFGGKGKAPRKENLKWLEDLFDELYNPQLPPPRLYPTLKGNVLAEWSTYNYEISLEIILDTKNGEYQSLDINTNNCINLELDLTSPEKWEELNQKLLKCFSLNKAEILP